MSFWDEAFLPSELVFPPHFLKIVVKVKTSELPHALRLLLAVNKGMLPVKYFRSNKATYLCQLSIMEIIKQS